LGLVCFLLVSSNTAIKMTFGLQRRPSRNSRTSEHSSTLTHVMAASQQPNQPKTNELRRSEIAPPLTPPDNRVTRLSGADLCAGIFARGEAMFDDFDPRDRDDDVRDIEMPWIELGRGPASDREADDPRDRDEDIRDRDRDPRDRD